MNTLGIICNEQEDKTVRYAAKVKLLDVHARLQTTTLAGDPEKPLKVDNMSDLEAARGWGRVSHDQSGWRCCLMSCLPG